MSSKVAANYLQYWASKNLEGKHKCALVKGLSMYYDHGRCIVGNFNKNEI
jgi:hypothetical protein